MTALRLELLKLRRKHVGAIVLAMVGATLAWLSLSARSEGPGSATGWRSLLYAAPLMNSVFLSLLASVVASRVADVDHEADAWKELLCLQPTRPLLAAKVLVSLLILLLALALETAGICVIGRLWGFSDLPAAATWASYLAAQLASCLGIIVIVGTVALLRENQFVSMATGLALSLAGLFSSFLPTALQRLVPSSYFSLLTTLRIRWPEGSSAPVFSDVALPWRDYALLAALIGLSCAWSAMRLSRREP